MVLIALPSRDLIVVDPVPTIPKLAAELTANTPALCGDHLIQVWDVFSCVAYWRIGFYILYLIMQLIYIKYRQESIYKDHGLLLYFSKNYV